MCELISIMGYVIDKDVFELFYMQTNKDPYTLIIANL